MVTTKMVWVMLLVVFQGTPPVPIGTFSTEDACLNASVRAETYYKGKRNEDWRPAVICAPVEKPWGK